MMGLSFTVTAGPRQRSFSGPSPAGLMTAFYCLGLETPPTWRARSPYFISPRNRMARLYPQAMGSLFVASYDSQGYGGGIRLRLHTGLCRSVVSVLLLAYVSPYSSPEITLHITPTQTANFGPILNTLQVWPSFRNLVKCDCQSS
jgi:hypothetical protein